MAIDERQKSDTTQSRTGLGSERKTEQIKNTAAEKGREMKEEAAGRTKTKLEEGKAYGQQNLEGTAQALRDTAEKLKNENQEYMARYTDWIAGQVDSLAQYFRERNVDEVFEDFRTLSHRRPGVVMGGALLAGFLTARFLSSSGPRRSDVSVSSTEHYARTAGRSSEYY